MNLVCNIIFFATAILTIIYDYKTQQIPLIIILLNYISICLLVSPYLLVGIFAIIICKKLNKPIDSIYVLPLCYIFITTKNLMYIICIIPMLIQTIMSKRDKISFMIAIELSYIIIFITKLL